MTKEELKKCLSTHKDRLVCVGCYLAGTIGICVAWRMASKRHNNYTVTDFTVSDLGKLGECLIEQGCGANDRVLKWKMYFEKCSSK